MVLPAHGFPFRFVSTEGDKLLSKTEASQLADLINRVPSLETSVNSLLNSAFNSGRPFTTFNDGFVIDSTNAQTYEGKNLIYGAKADKGDGNANRPDVRLPSDSDITASGETYPYEFEVTHLGGTIVGVGNQIRFVNPEGTGFLQIINRNQQVFVIKRSAEAEWEFTVASHDTANLLLPSGVFNLNTETTISSIANVSTILNGVTITAGEAFVVETGGDYWGAAISDNSVVVAITDSPGLLTTDEDDWIILNRGGSVLTNDELLFLNQITRTGTRFDLSRNVFLNPSNVESFSSMSSGVPLTLSYSANYQQNTIQSVTFQNQALQFSELSGGNLNLDIEFSPQSSSGFLPELLSVSFDFSGTVFTFPLMGYGADSGRLTLNIAIPNQDYSLIFGTNCDITLNFSFRGNYFSGSMIVRQLVNTSQGPLRNPIEAIARTVSGEVSAEFDDKLNKLARDIDTEGSTLSELQNRISPIITVAHEHPFIDARFRDSTGSEPFPTDLSVFTEVSAANPRWTLGNTAIFVALASSSNTSYTLRNITQSSEIPLDGSNPNVDLGASTTSPEGVSYFIYRVTGLTVGDIVEVESVTFEDVPQWGNDIDNLKESVERIDTELQHAALNLDDKLIDVLDNEVTVTEEDNPTVTPSLYNKSLSNDGSQAVFYEVSPNAGSGGLKNSDVISNSLEDSKKLLYFPEAQVYANSTYVTAFDGSISRDLITYVDGTFNAKQRVAAIPQSSRTESVYPAPANRVSGEDRYFEIPTITFVNGIPQPEADELFFTRNLPQSATTLTINYRDHENGNLRGQGSTTLAGVGGSSEVATTFTLNDGSESATVEVRWYPSRNAIRVSVTETVYRGLPTINDVDVQLVFSRTVTVPATPETVRDVPIEFERTGAQVFAFRENSSGNLIISGGNSEVNTGYDVTTLFGATSSGHLTAVSENATFLNYEKAVITNIVIAELENRASQSQFGLFSTQYTHNTLVNFDTQLTAKDSAGNLVNLGQEIVAESPNGDKWRLSVDNSGNPVFTKITT